MQPRFPIYIISKGRWDSRLTSKALERMRVPYHIVVEPQEYEQYASVIDKGKILVLPFSNLGQGSIPARNWVWKHSIDRGAERHWILDDNIRKFCRLNRNKLIEVSSGTIFRCAEDFTERYTNVALSGFQYFMFISMKEPNIPACLFNTRIYSCILIKNDIPYQWRGRYNEDTDLSLRALKDGWCTILFHAFIQEKMPTMTMSGGNSDELYSPEDGRLKMAESLCKQHPDVSRITWKWNRWQHHVNYRPFQRNKLIKRPDLVIKKEIDNYGMVLREFKNGSIVEPFKRRTKR